MNWLHFSDFHVGGARGPQMVALRSIIQAVAQICEHSALHFDAVFLAGDLAYSGKREEYDRFRDDFYLPLLEIPGVSNAKVFAVPGNHDVDCRIGVPITWDSIQKRNQDIFFSEDDEGKRVRRHRAELFEAYWDFINAHGILSPNPHEEVSKLFEFPDFPVAIIATNTAFFSDISESKHPKSTPIPLLSLRSLIQKAPEAKPSLILGHHSPDAFRSDQLRLLKTFLSDEKAFYLHGHEHDVVASFNGDSSLRSLGFGAAYLGSFDGNTDATYVNTFALCSLSNQLSLKSFSWQRGRWVNTTAIQFAECTSASNEDIGHVSIVVPTKAPSAERSRSQASLGQIRRAHPNPSRIIPIAAPNEGLWVRLIQMSDNVRRLAQAGELNVAPLPEADGKWQGVLETKGARHLLVCIPGGAHILSAKEVESLNTRLDTEDFNSVTVVSFGSVSEDARSMYLRLQNRKPIEILTNTDLSEKADHILSAEQKRHIYSLDAATSSIRLLVGDNTVFCLVINGLQGANAFSFYLLDEEGGVVGGSDPIVAVLRKSAPELAAAPYSGESFQVPLNLAPAFDETRYLQQCFAEHNTTKYAALANIGFRFSDLPLKELYVNATAAEVTPSGCNRLEALVEDHLSQYAASEALKAHIQRELLSKLTQETHQETSDAREFCQKYGSVLLTGDPGSGKTCFVKNEILAYCERAVTSKPPEASGWHATHVPMMLQLSEVVAEQDFGDAGVFRIAERLLERKGLALPYEEIVSLASQGRLAMFFDGLDEVVSVEKRAIVVRQINEVVESFLTFGNRVVVTSRPAALHVVNLLPALHRLELQGLNETNIRKLAHRLLSLKVVDTPEGVLVDEKNASTNEVTLVDQLLRDCKDNPGIGRLAQNPLLLTLLILIYANSGAPSAKRHRIYEDAIKTLSSVRTRESGHAPISAQDLRERLGAIALAVYKKESGLLPTRSEVRSQVHAVMEKQRGEPVNVNEADQFIQKVAESTGLITIGGRQDEESEDAIVTFMHHSFLEYFAAIGLSLDIDSVKIEELVREPRWHEILTLLAGIVGESADVAPMLARLLQASGGADDVDSRLLAFAMDCALECEIPSETAQRVLAKALTLSIKSGPARTDPWVRAELGQRLTALFRSCGTGEFEKRLVGVVDSGTDDECAATIRILGYACSSGEASEAITSAIIRACGRNADVVACAICWASGEAPVFRNDTTLQVIANNLNRTRRRKQTAFDAVARIPGLAAKHWPEIINGMDDDDDSVRRAASYAAVQAGINADVAAMHAGKKDVLLRAFRLIEERPGSEDFNAARIRPETLERLLESGDRRNRLIAIGMLPLAQQSPRRTYERLFEILTGRDEREEIVAALIALRYSGEALLLLSVSDLKTLGAWLENGTGDIRKEAMRILGMFSRDVTAMGALIRLDPELMGFEEFSVYMAALGGGKVLKEESVNIACRELDQILDAAKSMNEGNVKRACACLDALRRLESDVSDRIVSKVKRVVDDYKSDPTLRIRALIALPAIATPSVNTVLVLTQWIERAAPEFEEALVQLPSTLAAKCRQSVDYVVACIGSLASIREAAIRLHCKISARQATRDTEFRVTELRNGIEDLSNIISTFNEFIRK